MADKDSNKEILKKVCHLCRNRKITEARNLINQAAGITPEEKARIPVGGMSSYIMHKCKNPTIQRMVQVENAFYELYALARLENEPTSYEAMYCIDKLNGIMPLLSKDDKLYVKYWQSYYYRYACPDNDRPRYDLLLEVIQKTPKGRGDSDGIYASCARQIEDLALPVADLYDGIKLAQHKTTPAHPLHAQYKDTLSKLAPKFYNVLLSQACSATEDQNMRISHYRRAIDVVNDFAMSDERKNAYKLYLYNQLLPLQREHSSRQEYYDSCRKQQHLIYCQARLKKRMGIYSHSGFDRYY